MIGKGLAVGFEVFPVDKLKTMIAEAALSGESAADTHVGCKYDAAVSISTLRGAPKGAALELNELRMVKIDGLDLNPCGGTHLRSLAEINVLKIISTEKDRGNLRVSFIAGNRAISYFSQCLKRENAMCGVLSAPPKDHFACIDKLLRERRETGKKLDVVSQELAVLWGKELANDSRYNGIIAVHRSGSDLKFLIKAASTVLELNAAALVFISGDDGTSGFEFNKIAALTDVKVDAKGKSKAVVPHDISGPFVLFGSKVEVDSLKSSVLSLISGKGGGKPGLLQGQATHLERSSEVVRLMEECRLSLC
jgi:alanyl-tRNA synthetase